MGGEKIEAEYTGSTRRKFGKERGELKKHVDEDLRGSFVSCESYLNTFKY